MPFCIARLARRWRPRIIYCDNGTNFRGAFNDLAKLDWHKISRETSTQKIVWKFIPPTAAWWGGWWESRISVTQGPPTRRPATLLVFTDGSATASFGRAGAGAFSNSFNLKEPLSAWSDNFDAGRRGFDAASTLPSDASSKRQVTSQGQIATEEDFHSYKPGCWQILVLSARCPKTCSALEGVACFRIITGHDYLQTHLFKIGLSDSLLYPHCKSVPMTGEHLSDCSALLHVLSQDNCGVLLPARVTSALYWTARRLMSERTLAGVI
ncbi:integrase catalytic domain-containing protein [Trichonephila clavipes]|uniref:Integrase catalytic domain-containing protein n=1 Tax=Trichonephila clavipes TaxID=2585209 RepID=A0A8X6V3W2_TRICX|nr:integrase catalytic domain-containing protein [Trichonephila clavipes]